MAVETLATLAVNIQQTGGEQTAAALDKVAASGAKAEAATKSYTSTVTTATSAGRISAQELADRVRRFDELYGSLSKASGVYENNRRVVLQHAEALKLSGSRYEDERRIVLAHAQALEMDAAMQNKAAGGAGLHGLQLGRLNQELGTFIGRLTDSNTAASRLTAQIGGAAAGYAPMIAALAVVAGAVAIYDHITEGARKAAEEQKKLTDETVKWFDAQRGGQTAEYARQIEATTKSLADQQKQLEELTKALETQQNAYNAKTGLRDEFAIAQTRGQIDTLVATMQKERDAIAAMNADIVKENNDRVASMSLAIERQQALNDVIGQGEGVAARLANTYDGLAEKQRLAATVGAAQLGTVTALAEKQTLLNDYNIVFSETFKRIADATQEAKEQVDRYGEALDKILPTIDKFRKAFGLPQVDTRSGVERALAETDTNNANSKFANAVQQLLNSFKDKGELGLTVTTIAKGTKEWYENIEKTVASATRFSDQIGVISRQSAGIVNALTQAAVAFAKLPDLKNLTTLRPNGDGTSDTALSTAQFGASFIPGATAVIGIMDSLNKAIGATADQIQKEIERRYELAKAITASMDAQRLALGDISEMMAATQRIHEQADAIRAQINDAYRGNQNATERNRLLGEENALEARSVQALIDKEKAQHAANNAMIEAQIAAQKYANALADAQEAMRIGMMIATDQANVQVGSIRAHLQAVEDEQKRIAQAQLDTTQNLLSVAKDQLSEQEKTVTSLQRTLDTLKTAQASLLIGPQSVLSPMEQYLAAKSQLGTAYTSALGGDAVAASQVPDLINQFLQLSQSLFASTSQYGGDFGYASGLLDTLTDQYSDNLTTAQLTLAQAQRQTDYLAQIVTLLGGSATSGASGSDGTGRIIPSVPAWWLLDPVFRSSFGSAGMPDWINDPTDTTRRTIAVTGGYTTVSGSEAFSDRVIIGYENGHPIFGPAPSSANASFSSMSTGIASIATNTNRLASIDTKLDRLDDLDDRMAALNERMGAIEQQNRFARRGGGVG